MPMSHVQSARVLARPNAVSFSGLDNIIWRVKNNKTRVYVIRNNFHPS